MFDLGMAELLVIGVVALIVVGPKDLPILFRRVGQFVGKAKGMAREFSSAMNQAADEAGVSDIKKSLDVASNPVKSATDSVKDAAKSFQNWEPDSETGKLAKERADAAKKIHDATAKKALERQERERAAAAAAEEDPGMVDDTAPVPAAKPEDTADAGDASNKDNA